MAVVLLSLCTRGFIFCSTKPDPHTASAKWDVGAIFIIEKKEHHRWKHVAAWRTWLAHLRIHGTVAFNGAVTVYKNTHTHMPCVLQKRSPERGSRAGRVNMEWSLFCQRILLFPRIFDAREGFAHGVACIASCTTFRTRTGLKSVSWMSSDAISVANR